MAQSYADALKYIQQDSLAQGNVNPPTGSTWTGPNTWVSPSTGTQQISTNNVAKTVKTGSSSGSKSSQPSGPTNSELNAIYDPVKNYLKGAMSSISSQQQSVNQDIGSMYQEGANTLNTNRDQSNAQLDTQQAQGEQRQQDALSAAVKLYNELLAGGQQRFGGASSAGEAYQSLAGTELQRNQGDIQRQFADFSAQVAQAKQKVQQDYNTAIQNLELQKTRSLNEAQRSFQDKILQINSMMAQNESERANRKLSALQDLRNKVFQINYENAQATSSVNAFRDNMNNEISAFEQSMSSETQNGMDAGGMFNASTSTNPVTALQTQSGLMSQAPSYMGSISGGKKDEFGNPIFG